MLWVYGYHKCFNYFSVKDHPRAEMVLVTFTSCLYDILYHYVYRYIHVHVNIMLRHTIIKTDHADVPGIY